MDHVQRQATTNEYKLINSGNLKLSKKFFAKGSHQILLSLMNVVEEDVILRGDLGKITIGNASIIDSGAVLRPSLDSPYPPFEYKHISIGANCYIGKNTIICAPNIGDNVFIGANSIVSDRVEIGSNVRVLEDSYIPPDIKIPDNCVFGGNPAKFLGEITEAMDVFMSEYCNNYYKNIIVLPSTIV